MSIFILFQVMYAIKEYACTAIDVLARRTRLAFLNVQAADEALPTIVEIMGKELGWSKSKKTVCNFVHLVASVEFLSVIVTKLLCPIAFQVCQRLVVCNIGLYANDLLASKIH